MHILYDVDGEGVFLHVGEKVFCLKESQFTTIRGLRAANLDNIAFKFSLYETDICTLKKIFVCINKFNVKIHCGKVVNVNQNEINQKN